MGRRIDGWRVGVVALMMALAGCGGGSVGPEPAYAVPDTLAADGGRVVGAGGVSVHVPQGALVAPVTIRIAADAAGAPPLPAGMRAAGSIYTITPLGSVLAKPVEVRIPPPPLTLGAHERLVALRAEPGGRWQIVGSVDAHKGTLVAQVDGLGLFTAAVVERAVPLAVSADPIAYTRTLSCGGQDCAAVVGTVAVSFTATSNGGVFPADCTAPSVRLYEYRETSLQTSQGIPLDGITVQRTIAQSVNKRTYRFVLRATCGTTTVELGSSTLTWRPMPSYPALWPIAVPAGLQAAPGSVVSLTVNFAGGASGLRNGSYSAPTVNDAATIEWQRSDDQGGSWRSIGTSYQHEAAPKPYAAWPDWAFWSSRIGIPVSAGDGGALFRARACYLPPDVAAPPCVVTRAVPLTLVQVPALPAFGTPPAPLRIVAGQTASFNVVASGLPGPTLQWQTRAANATGAWKPIVGATDAAYTTPALQLASNGVQYRVVATNAVGSTASLPVTVSIDAAAVAPEIATQPVSIAVIRGSDAVFAARATGTGALSYQWRRNGVNITGANAAVLRLPAVTSANAGSYSVVVTNTVGSVTSAGALLTVNPVPPTFVAPTIVAGPTAASVAQGQSVAFTVGVTGSGPFTYQWRRNGTPIAGATAASYVIASAQTSHQGNYAVVVSSGGVNAISAGAALTVTAAVGPTAPTIGMQPAGMVVQPFGTITLAVVASGTGPLIYEWFQDGSPIAGSNSPVLTIDSVDAIFAGQYTVQVSNAQGSITSSPAEVIVVGAPQITAQPQNQAASEGATATFTVQSSGQQLRHQWTRNGVAIDGATDASYTTDALALADSGAVYGVIVYNGAGLVIGGSALLTVTADLPAPGMALFAGDFIAAVPNGSTGDGTGTAARFNEPQGIVADGAGNLYVANRNGGYIAKVSRNAVVTRIAEHAFAGSLALDGGGNLLSMQVAGGTQTSLRVLGPLQAGAATQAWNCGSTVCGGTISPNRPFAAIAGEAVYTAWQDGNFVTVSPGPLTLVSQPINFFAGTTDLLNRPAGWVDGSGTAARFNTPSGIAVGPDGTLYVADMNNHVIRRITPAGVVSTVAGTGTVAGSADGAALSATFNRPVDLGFDDEGSLWVLQLGAEASPYARVRKIAGGQVSTPIDLQAEIIAAAGGPTNPAVTNGFTNNVRRMAVIGPKQLAFTVSHALLLRTLP